MDHTEGQTVPILQSLIVLLPLFGAIIIGLGGFLSKEFRKSEKLIGALGTMMVAIPFVIILVTFFQLSGSHDHSSIDFGLAFGNPLSWMASGKLDIAFTYTLDHLSMIMALVITGVGSLIHLYSVGYMHGDRGYYKFFMYLNLFIFAMLNLVLGNNLAVLFLGWEGVGACSYFLIGFWYEEMENAKAAQKAFVANRIGDFAMIVGMMILVTELGTLDIATIKTNASALSETSKWVVPLLLFIAATGKSAQIPLYVWLPDAMAGPTPVSALIHAATMVTSGIYLIARLGVVFLQSPEIMVLVSVIGALTAIVAALIAVAQNDIKKVLAYSTVSQLGFMFMALGAGAFTTAIFHVMTHAFFKACLFLGSGSVIHGMDHMHSVKDPQDVRTMGGLRKYMPSTHITFLISTLAIAGIPLLSGFFSKDEIMGKVFAMGHESFFYYLIYFVGMTTAALTAFYMTRVYYLTFRGESRFPNDKHPHESPITMTLPLFVLAFMAIVGGFVGLPEIINHGHFHFFNHFLTHGNTVMPFEAHASVTTEIVLILVSIVIAVAGVVVAWKFFGKNGVQGDAILGKRLGKFYTAMQNKFYVDEFYQAAFIGPFVYIGRNVIMVFDKYVLDGIVNGVGTVILLIGDVMKRLQTGFVGHYAYFMVFGMLAIMTYLIFG